MSRCKLRVKAEPIGVRFRRTDTEQRTRIKDYVVKERVLAAAIRERVPVGAKIPGKRRTAVGSGRLGPIRVGVLLCVLRQSGVKDVLIHPPKGDMPIQQQSSSGITSGAIVHHNDGVLPLLLLSSFDSDRLRGECWIPVPLPPPATQNRRILHSHPDPLHLGIVKGTHRYQSWIAPPRDVHLPTACAQPSSIDSSSSSNIRRLYHCQANRPAKRMAV